MAGSEPARVCFCCFVRQLKGEGSFESLRDFDDFSVMEARGHIHCTAAMIWSQFWIWFDLRKQLTQKQRLIRTFDVGGSGIKTVAWHDQPRGP